MCEFGALTLKPAPLVSVKAQNLHITQTQNNHHNANMLHELCKTFSSNTTYDRFSNRVLTWSNDQKSFDMCYLADNVFLRDNLHFSGTLKGSSYCPRQCTHILTTNRTISNITTHYRWEWSGVIISFSRGIFHVLRIGFVSCERICLIVGIQHLLSRSFLERFLVLVNWNFIYESEIFFFSVPTLSKIS